MKRLPLLPGLLVLVGVFSPVTVAAAEPWDGPAFSASPDAILRAAKAQPTPERADVETFLEDARFEFDPQGRKCSTVRRVYRCLTEAGIKSGAWSVADWSPWCEEKPTIRARVITPEGTTHLLDPKTIAEVPAQEFSMDFLTDRRALRAPLPAVKVGAVIEEEIVVREFRPFFSQGVFHESLLVSSYKTQRLRLTIEAPAELPLRYEVRGSPVKPVRTEQNGRVRLVFDTQPPDKLPLPELYLPPEFPFWPSVAFSTGKSWSEVAAGYATLVEAELEVERLKPMVREVLGGETDRRAVAAKLLAKVQGSVRYTAVAFGQAAIVPGKPAETLARRYGDCKDQVALLAAMLRAAGQPAHLALLRAGHGSDLVPGLPGLNAFNHAIVYVPGTPPLWIDPTAREVPFGELPAQDEARWALVIAPRTTELLRTPRGDYRRNGTVTTLEYFLSESGRGRVFQTVTSTGVYARGQRSLYAAWGREKMLEFWKSNAQDTYQTQSLDRFEYTPVEDFSRPFTVRVEISGAQLSQVSESETVIALRPGFLFDDLPGLFTLADAEEKREPQSSKPAPAPKSEPNVAGGLLRDRKSPLMLHAPHVCQVQFRITPPPGFVPREVPKGEVKQFGPASIGQEFQIKEGGIVEATFRLDTGPGEFTASEVNALRQGIAALGRGNVAQWEILVAFDHAGLKHMAEGRSQEAIVEFRKLVGQHPNQPEHHSHYAQGMLQVGLGEAARQAARRAVELAPESASAHAVLASVFSHDLLGRKHRPGMDWSVAAEHYRKALQLDPSNWLTRAAYALLLEYSPDGRRCPTEAKLEESLDEYRLIRKQRGKTQELDEIDACFALLLLRTGKYAELERLATDPESPPMPSHLLAAIAAQRGAEEAEKKAMQLGLAVKDRHTAFLEAAQLLDCARLYPQFKAMQQAGDKASPKKVKMQAILKMSERIRRFEESEFPADDPRRPVQQLCIGLLMGGKRKEQASDLFVKRSTPSERMATMQVILKHMRTWRNTDPQNLRSPQSNADVLSLWDLVAAGDKTVGHRIRVRGPLVESFTCYVVLEDGAYRLLPVGDSNDSLGAAALDRLAAGDTAGAGRWLTWAWDEERPTFSWFDPFTSSPFAHLWRNAEHDRPEHIRLAATALVCQGRPPQSAIPHLLEYQKGNPSPAQTFQIDRALALAYLNAEQPQELLRISERMLKDRPRAEELLHYRLAALEALGRRDEGRQAVRDYLSQAGGRSMAEGRIAVHALRLGELEMAQKHLRLLADRGKAPGLGLHALAWHAVASGRADQQALDDALKALEQAPAANEARVLTTLAAIFIEMGKAAEALEHLGRAMDACGGCLSNAERYVVGRMAEHYGLEDVAVELYRKVLPSPEARYDDPHEVAQRRLKKLGK